MVDPLFGADNLIQDKEVEEKASLTLQFNSSQKYKYNPFAIFRLLKNILHNQIHPHHQDNDAQV